MKQKDTRDFENDRQTDEQICECGDYRKHHVEGMGRCTMPDDMTHGFKPCFQFRPAN